MICGPQICRDKFEVEENAKVSNTKYRHGSSLDLAIDSRVMEVVMLLTIDLGCLGCVNDFAEIQSL